jgi:hypothetical protein
VVRNWFYCNNQGVEPIYFLLEKYMKSVQAHVLMVLLATTSLSARAFYPLETDDTGTQGTGGWQLETSAELSQDKNAGQTTKERGIGVGLTYGWTDTLDIGLKLGHIRNDDGTTVTSGLGDTEVGFKWRVFEKDGLSFAVAPALVLPTGDDEKGLGNGKISFGLNLITTTAFENNWDLHANLAWDHVNIKDPISSDESNHDLWRISAALDKRFTEHWLAAIEMGLARAEEKAADENPAFAAVALVYSPSKTMDFSLGYKASLNENETDSTMLFGGTFRW